METIILQGEGKKKLKLIKDLASQLGFLVFSDNFKNKNIESERIERLRELAKKSDNSILPNDLTMEDILEEVRLARIERDEKR